MSAARVLVPLLFLTLGAPRDKHHGELSDHGHHPEPTSSAGPRVSPTTRHAFPEALPASHPTAYEPFSWSPPDLTARNEAYANQLTRENERASMFDALILLPWVVVASQSRSPYSPQYDPGWSDAYFGIYRPGIGGFSH